MTVEIISTKVTVYDLIGCPLLVLMQNDCLSLNDYQAFMEGSAVAQWKSAWLETEGPRVRASPASLRCVIEQDTFILA